MVENEVFYNPVQIFNRDFTILVMQAYINLLKEESNKLLIVEKEKFEGASIVDALSASGLRTIRFIK
jgi:tRNA (guanine26-N2/guanine27-N2)-dimethyltransferase